MSRARLLAIALALSATTAVAQTGSVAPSYRLTKTVSLGAPDRWDYVTFDPRSDRVFVAHGDHLTVVDGRTGAVVGQVEGAPGGTHGTGIDVARGRGYTDDGKAGSVKIFDLKTLKVLKELPAQPDADGVVYDPPSGRVYVINGDPGKVTVIDSKTERVVATVDAGEKLEFGVSGENGKIYVDGEANRDIVRIDVRTNRVDAKWPIPQCESPHGLSIDRRTHRLFASCINGKLVVVDAGKGKVRAVLPIGRGSDAVAFDSKRRLVFSSNGASGDLTVMRQNGPDDYAVVASIPTAVTARTMAVDAATGRLYLVAGDVQAGTPPGTRPKLVPGSLKLMILDPSS